MDETAAKPIPNLVPPVTVIIPPYGMRHADYVRLVFPASHSHLNGEYQTRGAICFPVADTRKDGAVDSSRGYWMVAGRERHSGVILVFDSGDFMAVGDMVGPTGAVEAVGAWRVFPRVFANYHTAAWWFIGDEEAARPYCLDIYRHDGALPKPSFIQLLCASPTDGAARAIAMGESGMLKIRAGGCLAKAVYVALPTTPEMLALSALAIGFSEKRR